MTFVTKGFSLVSLEATDGQEWAAAISIFPPVCEIIHIVPPTVEAFSQLKSESRPVKRWDKTTNEVAVSLKDTEMGWILWLYKSKKHCLNLMYELSALPYQQEIWTHFLELFPLANHSPEGLKGNNRCTPNKFSFLCWLFKVNAKLCFVFIFSTSLFRKNLLLSKCEVFYWLVSLSLPTKWGNEKKSKGSFKVISCSPKPPYCAPLLHHPHKTNLQTY